MPNIITRHTSLRAIVSQESRRETQLNSQRQTQATNVIISLNAESRKLDVLHPTSWLTHALYFGGVGIYTRLTGILW